MSHYLLSQDSRFLELNGLGQLKLDNNGEITIDSLKRAMGYYKDAEEYEALNELNDAVKNQQLPYLDALDNAIKFNRSQDYRGLIATLKKEANGKYSIVIVKRNATEEERFAKHV